MRPRSAGHFTHGNSRSAFFTAPLHYHEIPSHLGDRLAAHDVLILKGDLNYRRLLADRVTPAATAIEDLMPRLGVDLVLVRTMKSDICAGLPAGVDVRLANTDADWRFSGRYAVIHFLPHVP